MQLEELNKAFTVKDLIKLLDKVEDKNLNVRLLYYDDTEEETENYWLYGLEVSDTGTLGFENNGEVTLVGVP